MRAWGRLLPAVLVLAGLAPPAAAEPEAGTPPWRISNGAGDALYMPRDILKAYASGTRSRDGRPGARYWQNHSSHDIRIIVSPPSRRIEGEQDIVYTNNSPDTLTSIVFRLYMNAHQPEAMRDRPVPTAFLTKGITVDSFSIDGKPIDWATGGGSVAYLNAPGSTVHGIDLPAPLPPKGQIRIRMRWSYDLTADGGWKEGAIDQTSYFLAYFFPRVTNYSDYNGWDMSPFTTGREFNNDFADFTVEVNAPANYLVWATGDLLNPSEVLQPPVAAALEASMSQDKVTTLAEAADLQAGRITVAGDRLRWRWRATHVPDFAIGLSNHYRWDAASVVVDDATGRRVSVQAAYADSATDFRPMVESARQTLRFASTQYPGVPYPWPKTTIVLGTADEEYPMMVNDSSNVGSGMARMLPENQFTGFVAAHEILHSWFPFYMGINEKRYPFMDEGWTTAFEYLRNREVIGVAAADQLFKAFRVVGMGWNLPLSGNDLPVITPHDSLYGNTPAFAFNQYGKAALGYLALRDLMGDRDFRKALHLFMDRWHGKRPLPWDMFASFNDAGVGNHDWFFANWFFGYSYMDLAVADVTGTPGAHTIAIANKGGMAVPFDLVLTYADGQQERVHRTPAVWQADPRRTVVRATTAKPLKAVAVETGIFFDFNETDNRWPQPAPAAAPGTK